MVILLPLLLDPLQFVIIIITYLFIPLLFMLLHVLPQNTYLLILVFVEVEPKLFPKPQLEQVIIETLFRDAYLLGTVIKRIPYQSTFSIINSVIELPPEGDLFDNEAYLALLGPPVSLLGGPDF